MKFLALFVLVLACASAEELKMRQMVLPTLDGRIINGANAASGQFPYQVGMEVQSKQGSSWCGGSLISNQWVLTAAHCIQGATSVKLYMGATDRLLPLKTDTVKASNIIGHAKYSESTIQNDIALIKLSKPVELSSRIGIVKLATDSTKTYVGEQAIVSGWGLTKDTSKSVERKLQFTTLDISASKTCTKYFGIWSFTSKNVCCSSEQRSSTCQGDSGGPLVVIDSEIVQIGIVSYGSAAGCEKGLPVVFTRVSSYASWIEEQTGLKL